MKEMKLFFKQARRVLAARLVLCTLMFGVIGGFTGLWGNNSLVVFAADLDGDGNVDTTPVPTDGNGKVVVKDKSKVVKDDTQSFQTQVNEGKQEAGSTQINAMTDQIQAKSNELTVMVTSPAMILFNAIIYIALALINTYFFVQTCFDIAFLMAPAFRDMLSRNQNGEDGKGRATRFVNGLISEPALNAVGYNKSGEKGHIECEEMAAEVDWKGWLVKRLFMFICLMAYLALLMMGLVGKFVTLMSGIAYAIVKAVMNLISPGTV